MSGFLWLLASIVPIWRSHPEDLTPAVFNSTAAAAAVLAGLTALPVAAVPLLMRPS